MKCYVLHPDSMDMMQVKDGTRRILIQGDDDDWKSINYIFKKQFHVSPFMDMDFIYDWTFWHLTDRVVVSASMKKPIQSPETESDTDETSRTEEKEEATNANANANTNTNTVKYFNAFFDIERKSFHPFRLCYQLIRFPVYCMIIQVWIHVEAFKLFFKGVQFIPHPDGAETGASRIIGYAMAPFFTVKDWIANRGSNVRQAEVLASAGVHVKAE